MCVKVVFGIIYWHSDGDSTWKMAITMAENYLFKLFLTKAALEKSLQNVIFSVVSTCSSRAKRFHSILTFLFEWNQLQLDLSLQSG